ncbi:outer membrane receptor protein involved in Fe transport [Sphingomonas sp. BK345]|nr:outer membrane receptor protein involved in Fe transport [Sphingomonas sp. BK345]
MMLVKSARTTVLHGISTVAVLTAVAASAQTKDAAAPDIDQRQSGAPFEPRNEIVVTGTLFRDSNTTLISPATVLTAATLERANITTAQEAIRSVSADGAGSISTGFRNGFSAGGAAVSLRGLGVSSTVILIDGLRSANFPLNDDGHNAYVDLNSIPLSTVDHIEVLKDGASSTYGADAIGGVVNLISRKNVQGIDGSVQAGTTAHGDGSHYRATLTAGFGDYKEQGFNFYLNSEYTSDGFITNHSRGYPFNTLDLRPSGLADRNRNDDSLTAANPQAVVTRVTQSDLNDPLTGRAGAPLTKQYQLLDPNGCPHGTFTSTEKDAQGVGCAHNLVDDYSIIQPRQQRYSTTGRLTARLGDRLEMFASGSYSHSDLSITGAPSAIRQIQPFGGSPHDRVEQSGDRAAGLCLRGRGELRRRGRPEAEPEQSLRRRLCRPPRRGGRAHLLPVRRHPGRERALRRRVPRHRRYLGDVGRGPQLPPQRRLRARQFQPHAAWCDQHPGLAERDQHRRL